MNGCAPGTNLVSTEIYIRGKVHPACLVIPSSIINSIVTPGTPATPSVTGTVYANTSSTSNNVGLGYGSLGLALNNPVNLNNLAVGYQALSGLTTGSNNLQLGSLTGTLATGNNNTIVGAMNTLNNVTTLSNTIIEGTANVINGTSTYSGSLTLGNNNTISNSNTIVLGNNITTSADNTLVVDPTITSLQLSTKLTVDTSGLGYPLVINPSTGLVARSNIQYHNNVYCSYNTTAVTTIPLAAVPVPLIYGNLVTDIGNSTPNYNPSTGVFTTPHVGYYQYLFAVGLNLPSSDTGSLTLSTTNGSTTTILSTTPITGEGTYRYYPVTGIIKLALGQTLFLQYVPTTTASSSLGFDGSGGFSLQLLTQL